MLIGIIFFCTSHFAAWEIIALHNILPFRAVSNDYRLTIPPILSFPPHLRMLVR